MAEEGIDITAEQPKILTAEAVQESDVVITMGCGDAFPYFPGTRYEDWRLAARWSKCIRYDADMRTTVDLPPRTHARAKQLAESRGVSLSTMVAELTVRGLAQLDTPVQLELDETTGLPVISVGRKVTAAEVAELIDEDR